MSVQCSVFRRDDPARTNSLNAEHCTRETLCECNSQSKNGTAIRCFGARSFTRARPLTKKTASLIGKET